MCILHAPTIIGHVHICKKFFDFMIFWELHCMLVLKSMYIIAVQYGSVENVSSLTFSFIEKSAQFLDQIPCLQT